MTCTGCSRTTAGIPAPGSTGHGTVWSQPPCPFMCCGSAAVDHVLDTVPGDIVLGIPLGIGKPNPFVNALYRRIKANPAAAAAHRHRAVAGKAGRQERPGAALPGAAGRAGVRRLPRPGLREGPARPRLPPNIEVREFFLKTGDYLGNAAAQQGYISTNYTFVARDMAVQGMNVIAQAVAERETGDASCSCPVQQPRCGVRGGGTLCAEAGQPLLKVGVVNRQMPFMPNGAEVAPGFFDIVVTDPAATHTLFGPPNNKVSTADYAIGLHASSLVADGGTLQIGIGSLGDAIGQALIVRDRHGDEYRASCRACARRPGRPRDRPLRRRAVRLLGDVRQRLPEADRGRHHAPRGLCRRHAAALLNEGRIRDSGHAGHAAGAAGGRAASSPRCARPMSPSCALRRAAARACACTAAPGAGRPPLQHRPGATRRLHAGQHLLGTRLTHGIFMTGGFFLGPNDFYERLRSMPPQELAQDRHDAHRLHQPAVRRARREPS
jgi:hypothetical protein